MADRKLTGLIHDALAEALPKMGESDRKIATSVIANELSAKGHVGTSAEADFERMQWTFEIGHDCRVRGGRYLLIQIGPEVP
ncbi:hypothetical protein [Sediminicurvatus halobius]|uniref:Uncharacterized protein n=1 Tax=Sediminicurvatus halobius TaxID=2182432 RepID=A0A2U2MY47_9GAMM|nr:hypothetical protein [Spiribacter halobius]PWG61738.1 hypothetical protein DEM34_14830 [Spiribacter halobius]UEX76832.1 hypothetical protein LMH63_12790 [Spiribacter halobius]